MSRLRGFLRSASVSFVTEFRYRNSASRRKIRRGVFSVASHGETRNKCMKCFQTAGRCTYDNTLEDGALSEHNGTERKGNGVL